jgi:hypothetical protein
MAAQLQLASGYAARLRRDELPGVLRAPPVEPHPGTGRESGLFAPESRPVLRIAAIISTVALGSLGILAVALAAVLNVP